MEQETAEHQSNESPKASPKAHIYHKIREIQGHLDAEKEQAANNWVVRTVKIWFTLHKDYNKKDLAQFPQILDNSEFFSQAV